MKLKCVALTFFGLLLNMYLSDGTPLVTWIYPDGSVESVCHAGWQYNAENQTLSCDNIIASTGIWYCKDMCRGEGSTCKANVNIISCTCKIPVGVANNMSICHGRAKCEQCANNIQCTKDPFVCECADGLAGCVTPKPPVVDFCEENPCLHGGACINMANSYSCSCVDGYTGEHCENNINECASSPCKNGGLCTDLINTYSCSCLGGFTGTRCEQDINECTSSPCQHGGICTNLANSFSCSCMEGYKGETCEQDIDECSSSPCQNGGLCSDLVNSYTCSCTHGFTGTSCEYDVDECASNPCQHGGSCTNLVNFYLCSCVDGYTGEHCEQDIDECVSSPCQNGGSCINLANSFTCSCPDGSTGANCEQDIDECASSPCQNGGSCTNVINSYLCSCLNGFTGANCEQDIDECAPSLCQNGGSCINLANSYTCSCPDGFTGANCEQDLNECASSPCHNGGLCYDTINGFNCSCLLQYEGFDCSKRIVETRIFRGELSFNMTWMKEYGNETTPQHRELKSWVRNKIETYILKVIERGDLKWVQITNLRKGSVIASYVYEAIGDERTEQAVNKITEQLIKEEKDRFRLSTQAPLHSQKTMILAISFGTVVILIVLIFIIQVVNKFRNSHARRNQERLVNLFNDFPMTGWYSLPRASLYRPPVLERSSDIVPMVNMANTGIRHSSLVNVLPRTNRVGSQGIDLYSISTRLSSDTSTDSSSYNTRL